MFMPRAALIAFMMSVCVLCKAGAPEFPPPPSDPKLAAVFEEAKVLMAKAQTAGYWEVPANAQPWPCEVPDLQLRKYAYVLNDDEMDEKAKLASRKASLNAGMSSKDMKMSYRDPIFVPLVATCKNGLLDGPLEFFAEYTRVMDSTLATMEMRMRFRYVMTVAAGQAVVQAPVLTTSMTVSTKNVYKDPAMQATMAKIKVPEIKSLTATSVMPVTADDYYFASITNMGAQGWMTMLQRPTGPKRAEMTSYKGSSLLMVMPLKNSLPHGEQRMTEQKYGTVIVPAKSTCYEDGEIILTTQCDVQ
jgi:hypothetical protein